MSFRVAPTTWCTEPPSSFRKNGDFPEADDDDEWLDSKLEYITQAVKGMPSEVTAELKDEWKRYKIVKITRSWEGKLVLVSSDLSIWKKNPGKCRVLLSKFWWERNYPAWSCALRTFHSDQSHMSAMDVALLRSRVAEIPLWFPEGQSFSQTWVDAWTNSVEAELRQRAKMGPDERLPKHIVGAIRDSIQKVSVCLCNKDCSCVKCGVQCSDSS